MILSLRPSVIRSGLYESDNNGRWYFASEQTLYDQESNDVDPDDMMNEHKKITFATSHTWEKITKKITAKNSNTGLASKTKNEKVDYNKKAAEELEDQSYTVDFNNVNTSTFAALNADISYDTTEEQRKWSLANGTASLSLFDTTLSADVRYNVYDKDIVKEGLRLSLPSIYSTGLTARYLLQKEADVDEASGNLVWIRTLTRAVDLTTRIIPNFSIGAWYANRSRVDFNDDEQYETRFSLNYISSSKCWILSLLRWKKFEMRTERDAEYLMRISVSFLGQTKDLPVNFAKPIRERF
jgi:hypothetical protein